MTYLVGRIAVPIPRILPLATAFSMILLCVAIAVLTRKASLPKYQVAIIGNSMCYYNDLPRLLEKLGDGHIQQNSCLHGDASLSSILLWGNGMAIKWKTGNARDIDGDRTQYDFGACTVPQLLFGCKYGGFVENLIHCHLIYCHLSHYFAFSISGQTTDDEDLETKVNNGGWADDDGSIYESKAYDDFFSYYDGSNPCLAHEGYYDYLQKRYSIYGVESWDFVIMNDNTRSPARYDTREKSLEALST
jgi:hypothetical protein